MAAIAALSLAVSLTATCLAALVALPAALWIAFGRRGPRRLVQLVFNLGLGLPPVAVGLAVAFAFWRSGPLGWVDLLYTPAAMIVAQVVIVTPLIGTLAVIALRGVDPTLPMQLAGLGVASGGRALLLAREVAPGLVAAMLAGFGRAIAEVGAAQMTGGNIEGQTRVLTTATMLAVGKANFGEAFGYVAVLLGLVTLAAGVASVLQARWR